MVVLFLLSPLEERRRFYFVPSRCHFEATKMTLLPPRFPCERPLVTSFPLFFFPWPPRPDRAILSNSFPSLPCQPKSFFSSPPPENFFPFSPPCLDRRNVLPPVLSEGGHPGKILHSQVRPYSSAQQLNPRRTLSFPSLPMMHWFFLVGSPRHPTARV